MLDVQRWPVTLGRALDNDIVLDDPHVAPHHARIVAAAGEGGGLALEVLASRNGVQLAGRNAAGGQVLTLPAEGATLMLGTTQLRLRLPAERLAAEEPLPALARGHRLRPLTAAAALLALMAADQWIGLDPGADASSWLALGIGVPLVLALWCGAWALMSKLFQHRFDFGGHLRIFLPWLLAIAATDALGPPLAAALNAPLLWQAVAPLQALLTALLLRAHLAHVLPLHGRAVAVSVAVLTLAAGGTAAALRWRSHDSLTTAPYMSTLPPPALRLAGTVPADDLTRAMAPLAARLAARVKQARDEDEDDGSETAD